MSKKLSFVLVVVLSFVAFNYLNARDYQKKYRYKSPHTVGLGVAAVYNYSFYDDDQINPILSFTYEWVPKWCGIETGVSYTTEVENIKVSMDDQSLNAHIDRHFIQIPILWRVQTKCVNVSLGLNTKYYLGFSQNLKKSTDDLKVHTYEYPLLDAGAALKIGFPIGISKNWSVEPQVSAMIMYQGYFSVGAGVVMRRNYRR